MTFADRGPILFRVQLRVKTSHGNVHGVPVFLAPTDENEDAPEPNAKKRPMLDLNQVRQRLEEKLARRLARAENIDDRLSQPGDEDWEERATEREDDEVLESLGSQAVKEIGQIRQALNRIDKGTYGICAGCGKEIGAERLELLPYATHCMRCV